MKKTEKEPAFLDLGGVWQAEYGGESFRAAVPGVLESGVRRKDLGGEFLLRRRFALKKIYRRYFLRCEAVSYWCEISLNGRKVGSHEGMWDEFVLDVTEALREGENEILFRIAKPSYHSGDRFPLRRVLSGFIPDVCCTFAGIWGKISLAGCDSFFLRRAYSDGRALRLFLEVLESGKFSLSGKIKGLGMLRGEWELKKGTRELTLPLDHFHMKKWSPGDPRRYWLEFVLKSGGQKEARSLWCARRDVCARGGDLLLNGEPLYWRGALHWGFYDGLLAPTPDEKTIRAELEGLLKMGFNAVKHCLYVPSEKYLSLCDELGVLCWVEFPLWLPEASPELEGRIRREFPRICEKFQGHPSVCLATLGCEMNASVRPEILQEMYLKVRKALQVPVTDNSGSGECYNGLKVSYGDFFDYHFYGEPHNMENLMEVFTPTWRNTKPWFFGEFCDADTLRDIKTVREARKAAVLWWEKGDSEENPLKLLKPDFYLDRFEERVKGTDIRKNYAKLEKISRDHALTHRKATLEETRSFQEISGYNVTAIRDVPIATSGLADDLGGWKYPPEVFSLFNSDAVLVPAWDLARTWISGDRVRSRERYSFFGGENYGLHILLSNYGPDLRREKLVLELRDEKGRVYFWEERLAPEILKKGKLREAAYLSVTLPETRKPLDLTLHARLGEAENFWPVFLYPKPEGGKLSFLFRDHSGVFRGIEPLYPKAEAAADSIPEGTRLLVTDQLDPETKAFLKKGGKVFLLQDADPGFPTEEVSFWRESFAARCPHPLWKDIPRRELLEDLRYFSVAPERALDSREAFRMGFRLKRPVLRRYGARDWSLREYLAEYEYGKGRLMAATLRLAGGRGKQPEGLGRNVFGRYLFDKILNYLTKLT